VSGAVVVVDDVSAYSHRGPRHRTGMAGLAKR